MISLAKVGKSSAEIGEKLYKCKTKDRDIFFIQAENNFVKVFPKTFDGHYYEISNQEYERLMAKDEKERNEIIERRFG